MKKIMCIIFALLIFLPLTSCGEEPPIPIDNTLGVVNYTTADKLVTLDYFSYFDRFKIHGEDKEYTAQRSFDISEGDVVITEPGIYRVTGQTDTYCIKASIPNSVEDKNIILLLDNVKITSDGGSKGSAIYAERCNLTIVLCKNTVNTLSEDTESEQNGVITVKNGLVAFEGTGKLVINTSGNKNGIYSSDDIVINGGVYDITSKNHGIYAKGDMTVNAGEFKINAQRFGIKCGDSPDTEEDTGDKAILSLNGGYYEIYSLYNGLDVHDKLIIDKCGIKLTSVHDNGIKSDFSIKISRSIMDVLSGTDGIDSSGELIIERNNNIKLVAHGDGIVGQDVSIHNEGTMYITTMSDYAESSLGSYILEDGKYIKVNPLDYPDRVFYDHTVSCKGIKATGTVDIKGKRFFIDSMEDGIHAADINIWGSEIDVITEEDGIHGENTASISKCIVNVHKSYKGIKALKVNISNVTLGVVSFSDAIDSPEVLIEDSKAYLLDKIDTGEVGTLTVNKSTVVIVSNSSTPTLPTNKDISYVKCVVLKPQMAVSDRFINISGGGIDVTLKLSKSFKDKMSVTFISDKMEKGQYYAAIGKYEGEFNEIYKSGVELSDTYAQKLTLQ